MLDRKYVIENADAVAENCQKRGVPCDIEKLLELESQRKQLLADSQEFNRQANEVSKQIKQAKDNEERQSFIDHGRQLRSQKDEAQKKHDEVDAQALELLSAKR